MRGRSGVGPQTFELRRARGSDQETVVVDPCCAVAPRAAQAGMRRARLGRLEWKVLAVGTM